MYFDFGLNAEDKVLTSIQRQVSRRGDTNMSRKDLVVSALFNNRTKTVAYMEVLIGVLPCFQNFVKFFSERGTHAAYSSQTDVLFGKTISQPIYEVRTLA